MKEMLDTSARLLRLLSLLQSPREWTGPELAERLCVTTRTVRNDVGRLRTLGYPVPASRGSAGGYRLGAGATLPPLLLDDDEAVAIAVGMRTAAIGSIAGIEEASQRALLKLEQVLPSRLRRRVNALQTYTIPVPPHGLGPTVSSDILSTITTACGDHERLRFGYRSREGNLSSRDVEPYRLLNLERRWYLVAWDTLRQDWRTFRVDRIDPRTPTGPRFTPRQLPDEDLAAYVSRGVSAATWRQWTRVTVHAPAHVIAERMPVQWLVEALEENTCAVSAGADDVESLAVWLGILGADFDITDSPELAEHLRVLADRYRRASGD